MAAQFAPETSKWFNTGVAPKVGRVPVSTLLYSSTLVREASSGGSVPCRAVLAMDSKTLLPLHVTPVQPLHGSVIEFQFASWTMLSGYLGGGKKGGGGEHGDRPSERIPLTLDRKAKDEPVGQGARSQRREASPVKGESPPRPG